MSSHNDTGCAIAVGCSFQSKHKSPDANKDRMLSVLLSMFVSHKYGTIC